MRKSWFVLLVAVIFAFTATADTFHLVNGETLTGELLVSSANDLGVQVKLGEGKYEKTTWSSFSQEDLKKFAANPKLQQFVEPFIEITQEQRIQKTDVGKIVQPPRLDLPVKGSLFGAFFSSSLGLLIMLLLYAANIYAGYEVAIFRAQSVPLVCGLSAVAPVLVPIVFLSMPTKLKAAPVEEYLQAPPETAVPAEMGVPAEEDTNPMHGEGVQHPALKLHTDPHPAKAALPPTTTFQRGQFTFNRRFFETKFPGFFSVVKREAERDMVLVIKSARGEHIGQRISRIAANDLHLQVQKGPATEEVMIPFTEIQEIRLKHKDA